MNISEINAILAELEPDYMEFNSYIRRQDVSVIFSVEGGPKEDEFFVLHFKHAAITFLPSILHTSVRLLQLPLLDSVKYVPKISFDEEEFGENGFTVWMFTKPDGEKLDYFVAAERMTADWVKREAMETSQGNSRRTPQKPHRPLNRGVMLFTRQATKKDKWKAIF